MPNSKTTQLRKISGSLLVYGDLVPLVNDQLVETSPTGETTAVYLGNLAQYAITTAYAETCSVEDRYQKAKGLTFDQTITPSGDQNLYCYGELNNTTTQFSLVSRIFFPETLVTQSNSRVIFGIGDSYSDLVNGQNSAYIGTEHDDIFGYFSDGITFKKIVFNDFLSNYKNRVVDTVLTRDSYGTLNFYINGKYIGSLSGSATQISSSYLVMGNGTSDLSNVGCTICEAHYFSASLSQPKIKSIFESRVKNSDQYLVSSFMHENLNSGPSQWLDSKGQNHILLPISGAYSTHPTTKFKLILKNDGTSGFLGNGTQRDVLPKNYVLTDVFAYSSGFPRLSIGSTSASASYGENKIYSSINNRVEFTTLTHNRNPLTLNEFGVAHTDRSLYVYYTSSAAPTTFVFQGYVSDYGPITYVP